MRFHSLVVGSFMAAALAVSPIHAAARAADQVTVKLATGASHSLSVGEQLKVTYRDGGTIATVEGSITSVTSTSVVLNTAEGRKSLTVKSILRIEAVASAPTDPIAAGSGASAASPTDGANPGAPSGAASTDAGSATAGKHVFVLPMDGTVGIGLRHDEIDLVAAEADKYGPGQIIVLKINSNGGLVIEGDDIHVSLLDLKKRHRVVSWIEKAISGAAFTALHTEELYFMSHASLGSITMFAGDKSATGRELEAWLDMVAKVGEIGGRNGHIIRCMVYSPLLLSYDKDPVTGKVTWYETLEGEFDLSNDKENLDFTAQNGTHSGFIDGVADTEEDLIKLLVSGGPYTLHQEGYEIYGDWQKVLKQAEEEIPLLRAELNYKGTGSGDGVKVVQTQLGIVNKLIRWCKRLGERVAGVEYQMSEEQLEEIREQLQRQLKDARSRGNN